MSRTRIVKGKIYEKVGKEGLHYYSAGDIVEATNSTYSETGDEGIVHGGNPKDPEPPKGLLMVTQAYFASKTIKPQYKTTSEEYTVEPGDSLSKIAADHNTDVSTIKEENNLSSNLIHVGEKLTITKKVKDGEKVIFNAITQATLGQEVYVVVKYTGQAENISAKLYEKDPLLTSGGVLKVLHNGDDLPKITLLSPEKEKLHYPGMLLAKIKLRPKKDDDLEKWRDKLTTKEGESLVSKLSIKVTATPKESDADLVYCGTDNGQVFLNSEGAWFELGLSNSCCKIDEGIFFKKYNKEFSSNKLSDSNKSSLKKLFAGINKYYSNEKRCCNLKQIAYMLATAKHETANTFDPIEEYGGKSYFEEMYDPVLGKSKNRRELAKANGNTSKGDGVKYHGRGFVQLTWKDNYEKMKDKFGVDLVNNPDKALEHELAVKIMIYGSEEGIFTGRTLGDYINDNETDYYNARRVINGTDKASTIKGYAEKIEKCLKLKKCNC